MKGLVRGAAGLAVMLAMTACSNDDTVDLMGPPTGVQANPSSMFVNVGDSSIVLARLINDRNQAIPTEFTVSDVGAGIVVTYDAAYRPDYTQGDTLIAPAVKTQQRYFVRGTAPGKATFKLTSNGLTSTVTVVMQPVNLGQALSKTTNVVAGDTLTVTAPANLKFSPNSAVTFAAGPAVVITNRAADSSSISFIVGPGVSGVATVTNVLQNLALTIPAKSLATTTAITVPALTVAPTTVSTTTPNVGQQMTVALGNNLRFLADSKVLIGGREAGIVSVSADSSTATIVPMMGSNGAVTYTNIALSFLNSVKLALNGDKNVAVGATYAGPTDANATSIATASTLPLPVQGRSILISDNGALTPGGPCAIGTISGNSCAYYKLVLPSARVLDAEIRWLNTADLGVYIVNAAGTTATLLADAHGSEAGGPETGTSASLAAGTYYITVATYNGTTTHGFYNLRLTIR